MVMLEWMDYSWVMANELDTSWRGGEDVERMARALAERIDQQSAGRYLLGVVGAPGSGKSTLARRLAEAVNKLAACEVCQVVGMDGYHRSNAALAEAGLESVKGSPATFEAAAFTTKLAEVKAGGVCRVPVYSRALHEPVADAEVIDESVKLVIVEGNYLLLKDGAWAGVGALLDEVWYLDVAVDVAMERVRLRHMAGGMSEEAAAAKVTRNDRVNAGIVEGTRGRADRVVGLG